MNYFLYNSDNSIYDSQVFTLDQITPKISVSTSLVSKVGTYNLKLQGKIGLYGSATTNI